MKGLGGFLFILGVGSIVLAQLEMEFRILSWIDNWGTGVGWGIKIALIVVGVGLWLMSGRGQRAQASP